FWSEEDSIYRSRLLPDGSRSAKELDIAVLLAALHAVSPAEDRACEHHSVRDPRQHATLERLSTLFGEAYLINRERPAERAPAMGRYANDRYYSGGAYYFSTLGAAEFCYRAALAGAGPREPLIDRGDAFLETVRAYTPPSGELSEQFDQASGEQTSAKRLCWSYAAFISCAAARRGCRRGAANASSAPT